MVSMKSLVFVLALVVLLLAHDANATLRERILLRRQSVEREQESTTPKSQVESPAPAAPSQQQASPGLYPDLGAHNSPGQAASPFGPNRPFAAGGGPTPFVPFGINANRFSEQTIPRALPQPRPVTPAERAQSESFTNGLGKRLLEMVGIGGSSSNSSGPDVSPASATGPVQGPAPETVRALQNSTVLTQLNGGLNSVYNNLAKMYQETVEKQLGLLQDRFREETANSSQPWQQRVAQQVPQFFKQMASKVEEAQANLNRIWQDATKVKNGTLDVQKLQQEQQSRSLFGGPFDQFFGLNNNRAGGEANFFDSLSHPFGFNGPQQSAQTGAELPAGNQAKQQPELAAQLASFWHNEVSPQLGNMRNQLARVWRDLTSSGALTFEPMVQLRNSFNNLGSSPAAAENNTLSSELVDSVLKDVDMNTHEYVIIDPAKADASESSGQQQQQQQQQQQPGMQADERSNRVANQIQNSMVAAQREVNQLWLSLTNSLQNALKNAKQTINPTPQFVNPFAPVRQQEPAKRQEPDPAENEIGSRIQDLSKLQRDADTVYSVVQQQQQQQQQRQSLGDRFRNFFNGINLNDVDQFQGRFNDQVSRFGTVIGDFWKQIPERWDSFMQGRPQPSSRGASVSTTTTTTTSTTSTTAAPESPASP